MTKDINAAWIVAPLAAAVVGVASFFGGQALNNAADGDTLSSTPLSPASSTLAQFDQNLQDLQGTTNAITQLQMAPTTAETAGKIAQLQFESDQVMDSIYAQLMIDRSLSEVQLADYMSKLESTTGQELFDQSAAAWRNAALESVFNEKPDFYQRNPAILADDVAEKMTAQAESYRGGAFGLGAIAVMLALFAGWFGGAVTCDDTARIPGPRDLKQSWNKLAARARKKIESSKQKGPQN